MAEQFEFEERDIWGEVAPEDNGEVHSELEAEPADDALAKGDGSRKRSASSSSSSDSEYEEQLQENIKAFRGPGPVTESLPMSFAQGSLRGRPRSRRESLDEPEPEAMLNKLGTSMPINIPASMSRRSSLAAEEKTAERAATFVPPHLLDQPDVKVGLSLSSASGAKRERLLQRNAILRRTGFIEAGARMPGGARGALPELMDPLNRRMLPIKESHLEPSALSAALGSPKAKTQE